MMSDFLKQSADVYRLQAMQDALGGVYQDWVLISTVPCLVQPSRGGVSRESAKDTSAETHLILLMGAWELSASNQIRCEGNKYNVLYSRNWNSLGNTNINGHTTVSAIVETS